MATNGRRKFADLSDNELIERFRYSHDNEYIGELYGRYAHLVLGLCIKYFKEAELAKDATMNIFELLLQELKRHKIENFKSWLYSVTKNFCLQELRKKQNIHQKQDRYSLFVKETMEIEEDLHLHKDKEQLYMALEDEILNLNNNQRICVKMFYLEGKSYADISHELNFSLKEVKSHIQNGKRNLKNKLVEQDVRKE